MLGIKVLWKSMVNVRESDVVRELVSDLEFNHCDGDLCLDWDLKC